MVVAILFVDNFIFGASAASNYSVIDYNDYVTETVYDGVGERVIVDFPYDLNYIQTSYYTTTTSKWKVLQNLYGQRLIRFDMGSSSGFFDEAPTQVRWVLRPLGDSVLKLSNIPENTGFWVRFSFTVRLDSGSDLINRITAKHSIQYFDKDFNAIAVVPHGEVNYGKLLPGQNQVVDLYSEFNVLPPDGAVYAMPRIECFYVLSYNQIVSYRLLVNTTFPDYRIALGIGSYYRYLEQQQITNDYLDFIVNGNQGASGSVVDGMEGSGLDLEGLKNALVISKPSVNTANFVTASFVSPMYVNSLTSPFKVLWQNPTLTSMLVIVSSLVLVSFVFFGSKR